MGHSTNKCKSQGLSHIFPFVSRDFSNILICSAEGLRVALYPQVLQGSPGYLLCSQVCPKTISQLLGKGQNITWYTCASISRVMKAVSCS